jgi:hypothetical protein
MGRCPKNSSAKKEMERQNTQLALTEAAEKYTLLMKEAEKKNVRTKNGALQQIINNAEASHGLLPGTLNIGTVRNRVFRGNVTGEAHSRVSPLAAIEPMIVEYCLRLAKIGCALNKEQVITLAEDLIHGTQHASKMVKFKEML